jgi:ribosomal protein S18 acetylase RimI-like enzyme
MCRIIELLHDQQEAGLRLALRELEEAQFRVQVDELRKAEIAAIPSRVRVWGSYRDKTLTGSLLAQVQPGRSALLWPPRIIDGEPREMAAQLLAAALQAMAQTDLRIVQALLLADAGEDADLLGATGFGHFSDVLYLACPDCEFPAVAPASNLEFLPVGRDSERSFADIVEATYEETLDCPAVSGLRSIDDVLLGYRATGTYDPAGWLFVRRGGENVGCLILADYPQHGTRELVYMGLLPAARRQGFGVAIVCHALWLTAQAGRQRLVLAVDAANEPALRMYAAAGFQAWDRRSVFIRVMT